MCLIVSEGVGMIVVELEIDVDGCKVFDEVKLCVDVIIIFLDEIEKLIV